MNLKFLVEIDLLVGCSKHFCILQLLISYCVWFIMVTLTKHIVMNYLAKGILFSCETYCELWEICELACDIKVWKFQKYIKTKQNKKQRQNQKLKTTDGSLALFWWRITVPSQFSFFFFAVDSILNGKEKKWSNLLD